MAIAGAVANHHRAMQAQLLVIERLRRLGERVSGSDNEDII